jgi:hypothetical protein
MKMDKARYIEQPDQKTEEQDQKQPDAGSRYRVQATLVVQRQEPYGCEDVAEFPVEWNNLPMAGVLSIQLQFLDGFLRPLIVLGATVEIPKEDHPDRKAVLQAITNGLPKPSVLELIEKQAV